MSRFREKLSPANWMQGVTVISRKISCSWAPRLQNSRNSWAKNWGLTCDHNISNSAIYMTAIYRDYTVLGKDNCQTRQETFMFWDLVCLILEVLRYMSIEMLLIFYSSCVMAELVQSGHIVNSRWDNSSVSCEFIVWLIFYLHHAVFAKLHRHISFCRY